MEEEKDLAMADNGVEEEDGGAQDLAMADNGEDEEDGGAEQKQQVLKTMAPAIIAVHSRFVIVSVGAGFRVFNLENNEAVNPVDTTTTPSGHRAAIRAMRFDNDGECFVSAGDDKLVKLWDVHLWKCSKTIVVNKKSSAVAFSKDGQWLFTADKFGVVYVISVKSDSTDQPVQLLAHCCSIITSLEISPCGKFVVTADRDFKIRVSVLPPKPLSGAFEIQSFCLGHTSFVSCLAFLTDGSMSLLVSGGGDATIRLWDYVAGSLLDTFETTDILKDDAAVVNISAVSSIVAATAERFAGVLLLSCDIAMKKLAFLQKITLQERVCPTGLYFDREERLWLIAGASETREIGDRVLTPDKVEEMARDAQAAAASALTRVQLVVKVPKLDSPYEVLQDTDVPGGDSLLKALQGSTGRSVVGNVAEAAEAAEVAMKNLLSKRQYTEFQRERRKRCRNDKRLQK